MAAFLHRLSNEFEVVSKYANPGSGPVFGGSASCPDDKRPIAGGGHTSLSNTFITDSQPAANGWYVRWETDDDAFYDPTDVTVYVLCVPRL